jgi:hypothetical protein
VFDLQIHTRYTQNIPAHPLIPDDIHLPDMALNKRLPDNKTPDNTVGNPDRVVDMDMMDNMTRPVADNLAAGMVPRVAHMARHQDRHQDRQKQEAEARLADYQAIFGIVLKHLLY